MSFVPTLCDCRRPRLVSSHHFTNKTPQCSICGQALRVVPSCSYAESDLDLFAELSEMVTNTLSQSDASRWSTKVDDALWSGALDATLDALVARWPGLLPLRAVVGNNRTQQQRVLQSLKTILGALASPCVPESEGSLSGISLTKDETRPLRPNC